mmetsp:Transcript_803/g.1667  ORF Transcript_803/g.1667 Transcript_803/m.1667 type:complete len:272 (-) Transcript_803:1937-2752(-)
MEATRRLIRLPVTPSGIRRRYAAGGVKGRSSPVLSGDESLSRDDSEPVDGECTIDPGDACGGPGLVSGYEYGSRNRRGPTVRLTVPRLRTWSWFTVCLDTREDTVAQAVVTKSITTFANAQSSSTARVKNSVQQSRQYFMKSFSASSPFSSRTQSFISPANWATTCSRFRAQDTMSISFLSSFSIGWRGLCTFFRWLNSCAKSLTMLSRYVETPVSLRLSYTFTLRLMEPSSTPSTSSSTMSGSGTYKWEAASLVRMTFRMESPVSWMSRS